MNDLSLMSFGKHKGEKMANVPPEYLKYIYEQGWAKGDLKKYIEDNFNVIESEIAYKKKQKNSYEN